MDKNALFFRKIRSRAFYYLWLNPCGMVPLYGSKQGFAINF